MDAISLLKTGFIICLAGAILFFVISIVLFFVFDIKTIFMIRSGRAQAKTVKEMETANSSTGRLRVGKETQTGTLKKKTTGKLRNRPLSEVVTPPPAAQQPAAAPAMQNQYDDAQPMQATEELSARDAEPQTEVLAVSPADETMVLKPGVSETTVLNAAGGASYEREQPVKHTEIYFEIMKKIIIRDTEEVIR